MNLRRRHEEPGGACRSPWSKLLAGRGKTSPAFHPPDLLPPLRHVPTDLGLAFRAEAHRAAHLHRTCGAPHTCPGGRCQGVQVSRGAGGEAGGGFFGSPLCGGQALDVSEGGRVTRSVGRIRPCTGS